MVRRLPPALLLVLLAGCMGGDPYRRLAADLTGPLEGKTRRVAVLPFQGLDPALAGEGAAAAEHLVTRLYGRRGVELVERGRLQQVLGEIRFSLTGAVDPRTAKELGRLLGADALVLGTVVSGAKRSLELEARIVEVETGKVLAATHAAVEATGTPAPLPPAPPARAPSPPLVRPAEPQRAGWEPGRDLGPGDRLPWPLGAFGKAAALGRIYVVGGVPSELAGTGRGTNQVISAAIGRDGRLSRWRSEEPLPDGRYQASAASVGGFLFIVGGYDYSMKDDVFAAPLGADGRLGPWKRAGALPTPGLNCAVLGDAGNIYVSGCGVSSGIRPDVFSAQVDGNGNLGAWTSQVAPDYGGARGFVAASGRVYFVGGQRGSGEKTADVYSAPLRDGGALGTLRRETPMPKELYCHGTAVLGGRLWAAGGFDQGQVPQSDVYSAPLDRAGRVGAWRREPIQIKPPRILLGIPAWRGRGYLVGDDSVGNPPVIVLPDDISGGR